MLAFTARKILGWLPSRWECFAPLPGRVELLQCLAEAGWAGHTGLTALLAAVGGHAGYEMAPFIPSCEAVIVALLRCIHQLSGALNTVQHHDLHHRFPTRHFSLYFTHWDRWCGTEHPAYCEQVGLAPILRLCL